MASVSAWIGDRQAAARTAPHLSGVPGAMADLDFLLRDQAGDTSQRILAVPCGHGDHALAFARLGHHVTGIDGAPDSIAAADAVAAAERLPARFAVGDIESVIAGELFDGVICLGGAINRLDAKPAALFLNLAAAALRPYGWLALDSYGCVESIVPLEARRRKAVVCDAPDSTVVTCVAESASEPLPTRRAATSGELVRMLASVGLRVTGLYSSADGAAFMPGAERLLVTARRVY